MLKVVYSPLFIWSNPLADSRIPCDAAAGRVLSRADGGWALVANALFDLVNHPALFSTNFVFVRGNVCGW